MRIALVPNDQNSEALQSALFMQDWLERQGLDVLFARADGISDAWQGIRGALFRIQDAQGTVTEPVLELAEQVRSCDLVVSFGGDGTTLHAARLIGFSGVPLLSLNFGHLGFLSGGMADEMVEVVQTALAGEITPSPRSTLAVHIVRSDGTEESYFAFNELLLAPGPEESMAHLALSVNGVALCELHGDGIIVCSSTGSTAHALSAGGPIVAPGHRGPIIVPVAPHTLKARPVVCEASDVVEVTFCGDERAQHLVAIDGKHALYADLVSVQVSRGPGDVNLLRGGKDTFYRSCAQTFFS
jgi:NAD+ kinase